MASMISVSFGTADSAEAYGWANTAQLIGFAGGAAIAGIVIDNFAPEAAWYINLVSAALAVIFALATVRYNPSLERKDD